MMLFIIIYSFHGSIKFREYQNFIQIMTCKICKSSVVPHKKELFDDRYGYPGKFDIFVCNNCGFGQLEPQLKDSELSDLYTNFYPRKNITAQSIENSVRFKEGVLASISRWWSGADGVCYHYPESEKKVLDIGCGNAVSLLEMQSRGIDAYGMEEDRNLEKPAKELGLKVEIGNIYNSKYPDKFFDYVTLNQVLEHIPDPKKFLLAAGEKLKNDGVFIASFPNFNGVYRRLCGKKWIHWHVPFHLNHFTKKSIRVLADDSGFRIKKYKIVTPTSWSILQIENFIFEPKEREVHGQWGGGEKKATSFMKILKKKAFYASMPFLRIMFSIVNKFLDFLQIGDGMVVFFEKK